MFHLLGIFSLIKMRDYNFEFQSIDHCHCHSFEQEDPEAFVDHGISKLFQICFSLILRLGEHNLSSDPDCDSSNNCNAPVIYANVSQIINHPNYRSERNDVALLKLATPIEYTNYVLPICLPVLASQQKEFLNKHVFAAGWGTNGTGGQKFSYLL